MSLDKAIQRGKERREPYRGAKAVDCTCRNNGSCPYCTSNRLHSTRKRLLTAENQLTEEQTVGDEWGDLEQELSAIQSQIEVEEDPLRRAELFTPEEIAESNRRVAEIGEQLKGKHKHNGVWYWYDTVDGMDGGWGEYDAPLRRALEEIEQLPGLPADFIIDYIKEKEGVGLRIEYENAGACEKAVCEIGNRLENETWAIMAAQIKKPNAETMDAESALLRMKYYKICRVRCLRCGDVLEYENKSKTDCGQLMACSCRKVALDPSAAIYRIIGDPEDWEDLSVVWNDVDELLAEADREMDATDLRYSSGEVLEAMTEAAKP